MKRPLPLYLLPLFTLMLPTVQALIAAPIYTIQHLPGLQNNTVVRISDTAHVVAGRSLWYQGSITDLGSLGGNFTAVEDVNAAGQVVGRSQAASGYMQAFIWQNGSMSALPTLGGEEGFATAINNTGQIAGYTDDIFGASVGNLRATFWNRSHVAQDIGAIAPDHASIARALNNLGQVAGISMPSPAAGFGADAFFWDGLTLTPFIENQDPLYFSIGGLNDLGQVAGHHNSAAFVWSPGDLTWLGTLGGAYSRAYGINNSRQVVGGSTLTTGSIRAFLCEDGQMFDLNDLVSDLSAWDRLSIAYDINQSGQIVGIGKLRGGISDSEVFLLTPVPEPSLLAFLLLGYLALGLQTKRSRVASEPSGTQLR